jgi:Dolichol-phosphate mannosyltransferase subunit 3 (DPM3).
VVLWRVYNFNDCKEAAQELQTEIKEAKEYLSKKGYKF